MSVAAKLSKLGKLLRRPSFRRALLKHRVAATVEHVDAIAFCAPATLIDVGANKGQFSTTVRAMFPRARIHGFEPLPAAADRYQALFAGDPLTTLHRCAIGETATTARFFVTDREDSSSLLEPGAGQRQAFGVAAAREIEVEVKPLETTLDTAGLAGPVMLKIDVQGAELAVLRGIRHLDRIDFIYIELSFVELYEGQPLYADVERELAARGFVLRGAFNQAFTNAFGPTQLDCLFVRASG